ncbi:MAG: hypothetical protein ACLSV2_01965 [Clostridium sp.]
MKNKLKTEYNKFKKWLRSGSNFIDVLMLVGLFIIVATTFYISRIIGFYLSGVLLIVIPLVFYRLSNKKVR